MTAESGQVAQVHQGGRRRSRWWPAVFAAVIAFTVVLTSGAVLLGVRMMSGGSEPAPPPPASDDIATQGATPTPTPSVTPSVTPAAAPASTRLVLTGPQQVVDSHTTQPLPAGAEVGVPLPGVPEGATAVLLEVSVLQTGGPGAVAFVSGDETTPALQAPAANAQTSATLVVRLPGGPGDLRLRTEGGGHVVVTLSGAFVPAERSAAGRIVPVPVEEALTLTPRLEGNTATIDPRELPLARGGPGTVAAVLLAFSADVGENGGSVAVGPAANTLNQQLFWGPTSGDDRTRGGFLVVPADRPIHLKYHAGTVLRVNAVGYVTGDQAAEESAGLSVPVAPQALPPVTVPAGGRTDVPLSDASEARAVLVTQTTTPPAGRPRGSLTVLEVSNGTLRITGIEGNVLELTPRLLIL